MSVFFQLWWFFWGLGRGFSIQLVKDFGLFGKIKQLTANQRGNLHNDFLPFARIALNTQSLGRLGGHRFNHPRYHVNNFMKYLMSRLLLTRYISSIRKSKKRRPAIFFETPQVLRERSSESSEWDAVTFPIAVEDETGASWVSCAKRFND